MIKIGITGGIGSGKSTICKIFSLHGIPVYDADERAKKLYIENESVRNKVTKLLGDEVYRPDGSLNKPFLSLKIFDNTILKEKLEAIIHPAVEEDFNKWCQLQNSPIVLKEAALLFESGSNKMLNKIIVVTAPLELRIERVIKRDQLSRQEIEKRISNQWTEEQKVALADFIIVNDEKQHLLEQIKEILRKIEALL